eukprot:scaffold12483_cov17-Tisochrysis_lutea.AAC.1
MTYEGHGNNRDGAGNALAPCQDLQNLLPILQLLFLGMQGWINHFIKLLGVQLEDLRGFHRRANSPMPWLINCCQTELGAEWMFLVHTIEHSSGCITTYRAAAKKVDEALSVMMQRKVDDMKSKVDEALSVMMQRKVQNVNSEAASAAMDSGELAAEGLGLRTQMQRAVEEERQRAQKILPLIMVAVLAWLLGFRALHGWPANHLRLLRKACHALAVALTKFLRISAACSDHYGGHLPSFLRPELFCIVTCALLRLASIYRGCSV